MNLKHRALEMVSHLGGGQAALSVYDTVAEAPGIDAGVDDRIASYELDPADAEGAVLFPLIPGYSTLCYRFCVLAHAFRTRGYRPILLTDDDDLRSRPELTVDDPHPATTTELCRFRARKIPRMFGFDPVSIGDVLPADYREPTIPDDVESVTYRGVPVSRIARTSTRKYLKRYTIDLSEPSIRAVYTDFLHDAMVLTDTMRRLVDDRSISRIVANEPYYVQGAVPIAVGRMADIDTYTQMRGYLANSILFGRADNLSPIPAFSDPELVGTALDTPLDDDERAAIREVMAGRKSGDIVREQYSSGTGRAIDADAETVVGVFTNLLWDASLIPEGAVYTDVYEWLSDTIERFAGQTGTHVVVKTHPAEAKFGTNESVSGWIRRTYDSLPDNITHLPPDTDVDTYALIEELDAGVVFNSTVGLEMAVEGLPVVVGGYPHYLGHGITYDPDSKAAYGDLLDRIADLDVTEEARRRAWRYAHLLFVCKHIDFPTLDTGDGGRSANTVDHADIAPGAEPFDTVVDRILAGEEVIRPSCLEPLAE